MNINQETLYAVALTRINYFNVATSLQLYRKLGSATNIMEHRHDIRAVLPDATPRLIKALKDISDAMRRAEKELEFDESHRIKPLVFNDDDYPQRLRECEDAPLVVYYRGTADLNKQRIISVVGTRHCTVYGQEIISKFISQLKELCPDVLVVSGLAYGVDIQAHRNALKNGFETVGVLAHGLDYLYPTAHRDTATEMLKQGGLLTEFMTSTNADKINFVRRNRIIAGTADATIVVESAAHGGGLITADIANSYGREVFAFPGNIGMPYSEGCNNLIRDNKAALITSAEDFVKTMGWEQDAKLKKAREKGIERQMFPELTDDETRIVNTLQHTNDLQANIISVKCGLPISTVASTLFNLELKGIVRLYAGGVYHLIG
ncbi:MULTISPECIES: DNA-processing protein DprA [Prevotellaceae]|uniref:DNA-processing protein DprA n=1 Tax=Leyella stercorea TaxID=363265 RepID=UPI001F41BE08|nr:MULTISPECIES: DNA-processing protein DprA [Prevotellaceae]MCF2644289.1 DNA-protecting protein DprA [Leyella stercorea]MCI7372382.1 DNA-processing protein DprA [Prevotella sp.]MDY3968101.1 DNA-processing protein DprA [Prevotella sp.]MDY4645338.1 DNA-processing protein DprA [Prevotella sp.]